MNRIKRITLIGFKPPGYNDPINFKMLWNQWLHQGFLWDFYSYDVHSKYLKDPLND